MLNNVDDRVEGFYESLRHEHAEAFEAGAKLTRVRISQVSLQTRTLASKPRRSGMRSLRPAIIVIGIILATCGVAFGASDTVRHAVRGAGTQAIELIWGDQNKPLSRDTSDLATQANSGISDGINASKLGRLMIGKGTTRATKTRGHVTAELSAIPTDTGALCVALSVKIDGVTSSGGSVACLRELEPGHPIVTTGLGGSTSLQITGGIVMPNIVKVEVLVKKHWEKVDLQDGAFLWIGPEVRAPAKDLRLTDRDGHSISHLLRP